MIGAWSGGVADTLRNRLIIWGGGHGDYNGNEVYALNLNANPVTLTRLNNPSPVNPNPANCPSALADGNPNSRHTYNGLAYITLADRMFAFNGSLACNTGAHLSDTWTLDLAALAWKAMDPVNGNPSPKTYYGSPVSMAAYDPNTNLVFVNDVGVLFKYDYTTNTYTQINNNSNPPFNSTPVIDPKRKLLFFIGNPDAAGAGLTGSPAIIAIDISPGSNYAMQNWTSQVTGCTGLANAYNPGVAYDSAVDKIVGWPNFGNTVWIFDPATKSCTTQTFAGGPPDSKDYTGASYTTGTFGRFQYFPALDAFAVVNYWTNDAYLLRIDNSAVGGTVPVPPPPASSVPSVTSFTASPVSVSKGASSTLTWTTSGATSVSISPAPGAVAVSGSSSVSPAATTTYTLTATNSSGSATAVTTVTVTAAALPAITSFTGTPTSITAGQSSTLSWNVSGATSISIAPGGFTSANASGTTTVSPSATTTYTLTATNTSGSVTGQSMITVGGTSPAPPPSGTPANTITITNAGAATANYPVQIGRPFVQGEIPNGQLPQASINGSALPTQVDVKSQWPDGSLKHALISFLIPNFAAGQAVTIRFAPGVTAGNAALTQAQMLDASYNFDAQIQLTKAGVTKSASARKMLTNGDYSVWASGSIATTVVLANHAQTTTCGGNAASTYDFGFDAYCPFSPSFIATFWPATHQVYVRFIGEISNTEQLENLTVDTINLTLGNTNPATVYTKATSTGMGDATRWTKAFWLGGTPPVAGYNHNLAYLAATKLIANYDATKVVPATAPANDYSSWQTKNRDLYGDGLWDPSMGDTGARPEVGPYPVWTVKWLYTGDYREQEIALVSQDLAAKYPAHWREGKAGKYLDRAKTVNGVGHVMSVSTRPTYCTQCGGYAWAGIAPADRIVPVGPTGGGINNFSWDNAHQPGWAPIYIVTGDYWYLEELWFWGAATTLHVDGSQTGNAHGRGPTGAEGNIPGMIWENIRGQGWGLRNRVETVMASPDNAPEKAYLDQLTQDVLAAWEGERNITGTGYQSTAMWKWGNDKGLNDPGCYLWCMESWITGLGLSKNLRVPTAIHFWEGGESSFNNTPPEDLTVTCPTAGCKVGGSLPNWEVNVVIYALGRAKEAGYPSQALLNWIGPTLISQVNDPSYNPYLVGAYRLPSIKPDGTYFTTWADIKGAMTATAQTAQTFDFPIASYNCGNDPTGDGACGAPFIAAMAMSMVTDQSGGAAAYNWIATHATMSNLNADPRWAIVPRSSSASVPSTCDLNGDGVVNATDVQIAINQALGNAACTNADLQRNGQCNVVDVQRVINASLGGACLVN